MWHVKDGADSEYTESDEDGEDGGRSEALPDNAAQVLLHAPLLWPLALAPRLTPLLPRLPGLLLW